MSPTHYIFVDFENVSEVNLDLIKGKTVTVILVLGKRHTSLPIDLVKKLLQYPHQVRLIETGYSGKNALDFVLSFHIGAQSVSDPKGIFHILSRDKGFDALISHLKDQQIKAERHEAFTRIPILGGTRLPISVIKISKETKSHPKKESVTTQSSLPDQIKDMTERLSKNLSRPRRKKTLLSHIHVRFGKRLSEANVQEILDGLISNQMIEITPQGGVLYKC